MIKFIKKYIDKKVQEKAQEIYDAQYEIKKRLALDYFREKCPPLFKAKQKINKKYTIVSFEERIDIHRLVNLYMSGNLVGENKSIMKYYNCIDLKTLQMAYFSEYQIIKIQEKK